MIHLPSRRHHEGHGRMSRLVSRRWSPRWMPALDALRQANFTHLTRAIAGAALLVALPFAHGNIHIPLFVDGSNPSQQSFVRVFNLEDAPVEFLVLAFDDDGTEYGPVSFQLDGHGAMGINSERLMERLSEETGISEDPGDLRLIVTSKDPGRSIDAIGYMRTKDGFVTELWRGARSDCGGRSCFKFVPTFNPASNYRQRSLLRLTNNTQRPVEVAIVGVDDNGESPGTEVRLSLDAYASRTLSASDLEAGAEGISGSLGEGAGKWRLEIRGAGIVQSLMESPTGHLTNLSGPSNALGELALFRSAGHPTQQSFARVINLSDAPVRVEFAAIDDGGAELGVFPLSVPASGARHFNSEDVAEWLGLSGDSGDLRLRVVEYVSSDLLEVHNYMRTRDGFLTSMNDHLGSLKWSGEPEQSRGYEHDGGRYHYLPFFNPGANWRQRSLLRIANLADPAFYGAETANVSIVAVDDRGVSRGGIVRLTLPPGTSRTLTSEELEAGASEFDGYFGSGRGKWRLYVFPEDHPRVSVMSLLESPTGHLTNLTDRNSFFRSPVPVPPPTIPDARLRALVAETLGKPADAAVTRADIAELTNLVVPPDVAFDSFAGLQTAVNLRRLELRVGHQQVDLSPLSGLMKLEHLELSGGNVYWVDLTPLASLTSLEHLTLTGFRWGYSETGPLLPALDLSPLSALGKLSYLNTGFSRIRSIEPLAGLTNLTHLILQDAEVQDLAPLVGLTKLQSLDVGRNRIADLTPLSGMTEMTWLDLGTNRVTDLSPLNSMTKLRWLDISRNLLTDLSGVASFSRLRWLDASGNRIRDLGPLAGLSEIAHLDFGFNLVDDLSPLAGLSRLSALVASGNRVADLSPLAGLTSLKELHLDANFVKDLAPLTENSSLGEGAVVDVWHNPLNEQSINAHIPSLESRGVKLAYTMADQDEFPLALLTRTYDDKVLAAHSPGRLWSNEAIDDPEQRRREGAALETGFYTYFEDEFDFLVFFYTRIPDIPFAGTHRAVSNHVLGLSRQPYYSDRYGSAGRLKGQIDMYKPGLNGDHRHLGYKTLSHEIMHQWDAGGVVKTSPEIDRWESHWGAVNFVGALGGLDPDRLTHIGGNRYNYLAGYTHDPHNPGRARLPDRYAPLEMYLAGFYAPEDVPSFWNAPLAAWVREGDGRAPVTNPDGTWTLDARGKTTHTIDDLIATWGPRVPSPSEAQWHFRAAAIVVGDDEKPVTVEHLKRVSEFLEGYSRQVIDHDANVLGDYHVGFYQMTGGRGTITFDGLSRFRKAAPAAPVGLPESFGTPPPIHYHKACGDQHPHGRGQCGSTFGAPN